MRTDMRQEMKEKLNLTDEQENALRGIRTETAKKMIDLRASLQKKRLDVRERLEDPNATRESVEALFADIASLQVQMKMAMFDADRKVMAQLNPEQQETWKEIRKHRMMKGMERFGRMGRGFRGGMPDPEDD